METANNWIATLPEQDVTSIISRPAEFMLVIRAAIAAQLRTYRDWISTLPEAHMRYNMRKEILATVAHLQLLYPNIVNRKNGYRPTRADTASGMVFISLLENDLRTSERIIAECNHLEANNNWPLHYDHGMDDANEHTKTIAEIRRKAALDLICATG